MKKIVIFIVSFALFALLLVGGTIIYINIQNNTKHELEIVCGMNGSVDVIIDNKTVNQEANSTEIYKVTKKQNVKLIAKPDELYKVKHWTKDGKFLSYEVSIDLNVEDATKIELTYEIAPITLSVVVSDTVTEEFNYLPNTNLLESLTNEYSVVEGYSYKYFIEETEITSSTELTESATITIEKTPIIYNISFKHNGTEIGTATYTVEDKNFNAPDLTSYNVEGVSITWEDYTLTTGDVTINTVISYTEYTVTFVHAGETVATYTYTIEDKNFNAPDLTSYADDRYEYVWAQTELTTGNVIINSVNQAKTFTISYDLAGGTVTTANPANYTCESSAITLINPIREGYTFAGWTGSNGTTAETNVTIETNSFGNKSYTATWAPVNYSISYTLNGGSAENIETYNIETATFALVNPTKAGYNFAGWTGTGLTEPTMNVTVAQGSTGNKSYTATWTTIPYTISYDLAGGSVATENPISYNIESNAITLNNPTKAGYNFTGWTGSGLTEPTMNVTVAQGSTGNKSYTATWTVAPYTISYDLAGGAVEGNPTSYNTESATITLINPTREGYTFAGWTGTDLAEATMNVTIAQGSTGNKSYTATWTIVEYTVTFYVNNEDITEYSTDNKYTILDKTINYPSLAAYNSSSNAEAYMWETKELTTGNVTINTVAFKKIKITLVSETFEDPSSGDSTDIFDLNTHYIYKYENIFTKLIDNVLIEFSITDFANTIYSTEYDGDTFVAWLVCDSKSTSYPAEAYSNASALEVALIEFIGAGNTDIYILYDDLN